jgi:aryl-alcohol dehydrogenase-like predicted oxidoreductase
MHSRTAARLGRPVSVIGLGTWQLGADWGDVTESDALAILEASVESGVTVFDTADVYGDGRSEQIIGRFIRSHPDVFVATKMGRRVEQAPENYSMANFRAWTDRSRANLGVDTLDLVQLHCPPTAVIASDSVFDDLDTLVAEGAISRYGVSVETADQALAAIARPGVASVQIILNAFRLKPLDAVLPAALEAGVAIIARVPLASGLLSGKYTADTVFAENDHRTFNRHGEAFDVGETFSGVDFERGVAAAQEFSALAASAGLPAPVAALAWLAQLPGVTTVIPGARSVAQAEANASAGSVDGLDLTPQITELYDRYFRAEIHHRW